MKLINILLTTLFLFLVATLSAQTLNQTAFEDQFEESVVLDESTRWLVFTHTMDGNKWVRAAFEAEQINKASMQAKGLVYVSDIHGMPTVISNTIAIPSMKKYDYPIGLDRGGDLTIAWKKKEDAVTVYQLNNLEVVNVSFYKDEDAVMKAVKGM
jgi:hypothetical protein